MWSCYYLSWARTSFFSGLALVLLASDVQYSIVDGCDYDEEVNNDILPSTRDNRNSQVKIRELDENDFVSTDTEDD